MDHEEFKKARQALGLSLSEMGRMLSDPALPDDPITEDTIRRLEAPPTSSRHRPVSKQTARLMSIYLDGYRPKDWPTTDREK